jgi:hypothetical protein
MGLKRVFTKYGGRITVALMTAFGAAQATAKEASPLSVPSMTLGAIDFDGKETKRFLEGLEALKTRHGKGARLYVHIDSPGGSVSEGWKIHKALNDSLKEGYNIRLVCKRAESMAAVILASFGGNRYALDDCKITTHAAYFVRHEYATPSLDDFTSFWRTGKPEIQWPDFPTGIWLEDQPEEVKGPSIDPQRWLDFDTDWQSFYSDYADYLRNFTPRIITKTIVTKLNSPHITDAQRESLLATREDFIMAMSGRSCRMGVDLAGNYIKAKDQGLSTLGALRLNVIDDVIKMNDRGQYEIDYSQRKYKTNCRGDKMNVIPARQHLLPDTRPADRKFKPAPAG